MRLQVQKIIDHVRSNVIIPHLNIYRFLKSWEEAKLAYISNFPSTAITIYSRTFSKTSRIFQGFAQKFEFYPWVLKVTHDFS